MKPEALPDPVRIGHPTPDHRTAYHHQGYTVVRSAIAPADVVRLAADVQAVLRARNMPDSFLAQSFEYLAGTALDALINSPALRSLAAELLGVPAHVYLPFTAVKGAGQGAFAFHQDNQYTRHDGPSLNCWVALADMTPGNGCLRLVPGSHRDGTLPSRAAEACPGHRSVLADPATWDDVRMQAGDICIFDRLTVHGSGANGTAAARIAYAVQFHGHDTRALIDGTWELLRVRPRFPTAPVAAFSREAQKGE